MTVRTAGYTGTLLEHGKQIDFAAIQPADLVFYANPEHVAIYIGNGKVGVWGRNVWRVIAVVFVGECRLGQPRWTNRVGRAVTCQPQASRIVMCFGLGWSALAGCQPWRGPRVDSGVELSPRAGACRRMVLASLQLPCVSRVAPVMYEY